MSVKVAGAGVEVANKVIDNPRRNLPLLIIVVFILVGGGGAIFYIKNKNTVGSLFVDAANDIPESEEVNFDDAPPPTAVVQGPSEVVYSIDPEQFQTLMGVLNLIAANTSRPTPVVQSPQSPAQPALVPQPTGLPEASFFGDVTTIDPSAIEVELPSSSNEFTVPEDATVVEGDDEIILGGP